MNERLRINPISFMARLADTLMVPVMYLVSGTLRETPQRTHVWNNKKLREEDTEYLDFNQMILCKGLSAENQRCICGFPRFHAPILGGWRNYVVLEPTDGTKEWFVGWICNDAVGVSRIPLTGPVRMLIGPSSVSFFGITRDGKQVPLQKIQYGKIGERGPYSRTPLL